VRFRPVTVADHRADRNHVPPTRARRRRAGLFLAMASRVSQTLKWFMLATGMLASVAGAQQTAPTDSVKVRPAPPLNEVNYAPLTIGQKISLYDDRTYSIRALLGASYAAGIAQWRHTPREWGSGISGYGRRAAAAYGGGLIRHTTEFGVGAILHEDPRFEPSTHDGFAPRAEDALWHTIVVRNDDGNHQPAWSRLTAAFVTGFAVNSWEPRRMHSTHHAISLSLASLANYATSNLVQEFTPDVKHFLLHGTSLEGKF